MEYLIRIRQFAEHFGRSPEQLGPKEIREFQLHLLGKVSSDVLSQYTTALRLLGWRKVVPRSWILV